METVFTNNTQGAAIKIAVGIDYKSAAILAGALFIALVAALFIYKKL